MYREIIQDRIIPVYIIEQIYTHRDEYIPSEDFYRNMQRILQTDDCCTFRINGAPFPRQRCKRLALAVRYPFVVTC